MDFGGLLLLALLWAVFNALTRRKPDGSHGGRSRPLPGARPPATGDATQREGSRLESLLREFERAMDQAQGTGPRPTPPKPAPGGRRLGRSADRPLGSAEEVEERDSLEVEPEVVSLEQTVARPRRPHLSQDEGAAALVARRIADAEARSGPLTRAGHGKFDQRIRAQPADATAVRVPTPAALRQAVIWRELLGPPLALRDDPPSP